MSGTRAGGLKARDKNKELYGNDWYSKIGKIGGKKCGMKGFALNHELAVKACHCAEDKPSPVSGQT